MLLLAQIFYLVVSVYGVFVMQNRAYICDTGVLNIACPLVPANCALNVISANFGRLDMTTCPGPFGPGSKELNLCITQRSQAIFASTCNTKQQCVVDTSQWGGDPCVNIYKYLEATYECKVPSCPSMFPRDNSSIPPAPYNLLGVYTQKCFDGYYQSATNSIQTAYECVGDCFAAIWSPSTFTPCDKQITCSLPALSNVDQSGIPSLPYYAGLTYIFTCISGYYVTGTPSTSATLTCTQQLTTIKATFQPSSVTCQRITCSTPDFAAKKFTANQPSPYNVADTTYSFTCSNGYYDTVQKTTIPEYSCKQNRSLGYWKPAISACQRLNCSNSLFTDTTTGKPELPGPYLSLSDYKFNCIANNIYENDNFPTYSCQANGTWNRPFKACTATCANISSFDNGTVTQLFYDDHNIYGRPIAGSNLSLSCATGMVMKTSGQRNIMAPPLASREGPLIIKCLNNQQWSSLMPNCTELQPPIPCIPPLTTVSCDCNIEGACPKWACECLNPLKPTPQPLPQPNPPLKKLVQVTYSMGCMAVVIILAVAMGIAFLNQDFDNSLEFVNFSTTMVLLLTYVCLMTVIDREGILVKFLNEGGCAVFAYILQFLFLSCFLLKVFKAIELLGIFGNILTNENMIRPFYIAFLVFWTSLFFTMGTYFFIGSAIGNEKTCFFNLNATEAAEVMIVSCAFLCWLAVIIIESSGCAPFVSMRIGRQEPHSKLMFTDYIRVMMYVEVPITFAAWIANIYAQFTQQVGWYPIAFGLNIIAGVLALQCQFGAGLTLKNIFKKLKKTFKKRMGKYIDTNPQI